MRTLKDALAALFLSAVLGIAGPIHPAGALSFTIINVPGAAATHARGINGAGQIVGDFRDAGDKYHGFVRTPTGTFTTIDVPGARNTRPQGINNAGQIVGQFRDAGGKWHGFVTAAGRSGPASPPAGLKTALDPAGRFSLSVPAEWSVSGRSRCGRC